MVVPADGIRSPRIQDGPGQLGAAEFFAGIGLVRMGLERAGFSVVWANDVDDNKKQMYLGQFEDRTDNYRVKDVADVPGGDLPPDLTLAWASFPCIDVSLAGWRRGLNGQHTGTFWHFVRILHEMGEHRPPLVGLENVAGLATSNGGRDMFDTVEALNGLGYSVDALVLDARRFVPQSRPRLFLVGAMRPPPQAEAPDDTIRPHALQPVFESSSLRTHQAALPSPPPLRHSGLAEYLEAVPPGDRQWWSQDNVEKFVASLSQVQLERLHRLQESPGAHFRTAYRRTRHGKPAWEIRADEISGCLRTARGGSSKQALVCAGDGQVRVRWMTAREYGNLMGASEFRLGNIRSNQALFGFGDAVCVDAVAWLGEHYLHPLARAAAG